MWHIKRYVWGGNEPDPDNTENTMTAADLSTLRTNAAAARATAKKALSKLHPWEVTQVRMRRRGGFAVNWAMDLQIKADELTAAEMAAAR